MAAIVVVMAFLLRLRNVNNMHVNHIPGMKQNIFAASELFISVLYGGSFDRRAFSSVQGQAEAA